MDTWTRLRTATLADHEAMERLPLLARLFADDYSRAELLRLLTVLLSVYQPLEEMLAASPEAAAIGYRPRVPLLRRDLRQLGGDPAAAPLPLPVPLPAYPGSAARFGGLYVVEGAVLGSQMILRHLERHFGPGIGAALSFYASYGEAPGPQWQRFRHKLEEGVTGEAALAEARAAACATFAAFSAALAGG